MLVLAKIASAIKRSGRFEVVLKPIGLLDSREFRFNISFENASSKDRFLNNVCLSYLLDKKLHGICKMTQPPLGRGLESDFVTHNNGCYGFFIEAGKSHSAVIDYQLPASFSLPENAKLCLSYLDENKRQLYALINLKDGESKLLSFKKLGRRA